MEEIWKDIEGYEGRYMISNLGRVKSMKYRHHNKVEILKEDFKFGYKRVCLFTKDGRRKRMRVHRLVAIAFIENPDNLEIINHKDENPLNNKVDNLEWCTQQYNINYGTGMERRKAKQSIKINQYDLNGNYIRTWDCINDAIRQYKGNTQICQCCKGKRKYASGYKWKYAD